MTFANFSNSTLELVTKQAEQAQKSSQALAIAKDETKMLKKTIEAVEGRSDAKSDDQVSTSRI